MNSSFAIPDCYPAIYKMPMRNQGELIELYSDILKNTTVADVHQRLAEYVTQDIEPIGWQAVWRTTEKSSGLNFNCDLLVEVYDVTLNVLEADVIIHKILSPTETEMTTYQFDQLETFRQGTINGVPLTELYVVSEGDEVQQFSKTAIVIEQVRFFYKHLWRAWDGLSDSTAPANDLFIDSRLQSRLDLFFDMQNKIIAESTVNKIRRLIEESWSVRDQLDKLSRDVKISPASEHDGDSLVDECDVYEGMRLRLRLEDIEREMKLLEDPRIRLVASTMSRTYIKDCDQESITNGTAQKCHLLSRKYTCKELKTIMDKLEAGHCSDMPIVFHGTLDKLLKVCRSGDKVYILPGLYVCDALPWIDFDIEICGLASSRDEVILQASDSVGDIFLNCNASAVLISNLTLRTPAETHCIVMIHAGLTNLVNCLLDGGKCARNSIIALSKAEVALDDCQIIHEGKQNGIVTRPGSNVTLQGKDISSCMDTSEQSDEDNNSVIERQDVTGGDRMTLDEMVDRRGK